jgi:hypothetical protein
VVGKLGAPTFYPSEKKYDMNLPVRYDSLTPDQRVRVRRLYITLQNGKCQHCGEPLNGEPPIEVRSYPMAESSFPHSFFSYPIHLHHDHVTGMTVGAVHARCNAYLKRYQGK